MRLQQNYRKQDSKSGNPLFINASTTSYFSTLDINTTHSTCPLQGNTTKDKPPQVSLVWTLPAEVDLNLVCYSNFDIKYFDFLILV